MPISGDKLLVSDLPLHKLIWERSLKYGDSIAFVDCFQNDKEITYKEMYHLSRKCATYIQTNGIKKGDFVAMCLPNSIEYTFIAIGIMGSGASIAPTNPDYKAGEHLQQFRITEPKMVFVSEECLDTIISVQRELECLQKIIVIGKSETFTTLDGILKMTDEACLKNAQINSEEDIATVLYSSGTTGLPKAVMLTHRNLTSRM